MYKVSKSRGRRDFTLDNGRYRDNRDVTTLISCEFIPMGVSLWAGL
jgi:hypothetical protein